MKKKRNQKIPVGKLDNVLEQLEQLNKKQKSELNLRESIYYLRSKLKRALKQGYSYEDLTKILAEQNIIISATTLKQYLSTSKRSASKRYTSKKQQNNSRSSADLTTELDSSQDSIHHKISINKKVNKSDIEKPTSTTETKATTSDTKQAVAEDISTLSKSNKSKSPVLSGSDQDLSHEFNQY